MNRTGLATVLLLAGGCSGGSAHAAPAASSRAMSVSAIDLPGAPPQGGVYMDYLVYDRARHRVWVPAGNTGSVDVIEKDGTVSRIEGFATAEMERRGKKRTVGPSSATVGDGVVYVGNRGDFSVCAVDATSLKVSGCVKLDAMPDAVQYVSATREVWVTTPRDKSIRILDVAKPAAPAVAAKVSFEGEPEGFAVDESRGIFYTNLEDKDRTLAIDLRRRAVTKTWEPHCGEDGPKGLALDESLDFLMVACPDHVIVLDAGHDGKQLSSIDTGAGIDGIDYVSSRHEVYAGAASAAKLTVAHLDPAGKLVAVSAVATAEGARNAVATDEGVAYLTDSPAGKVLVVTPR